MKSRSILCLCFSLALSTSLAQAQGNTRVAPDLILTGGKVFTADSTRPWAEALAIRGERIMAVGSNDEIKALAGRGTREYPLGGRTVIPGINDAHDHVGDLPFGVEIRTSTAPTPDPSSAQILDSLRAVAARVPAGTWIHVTIGLKALDDSTLRRTALDNVAPRNPVLLWSWWGHGAILNSAALLRLHIPESAIDPLGGFYERDAAGRLTGRLDEYAEWGAMRRMYSTIPEKEAIAGLKAFADSSLRMGVTTVQDMAGFFDPAYTVRVFREARLPIRVRLIRWSIPNRTGRNESEWNGFAEHPAPRLTVSGRKWVLDGTPYERFALMTHPYAGSSSNFGRLDFPVDTIRAILADALKPGAAQLLLHVVGDSTPAVVLALMESLAPDSVWRAKRVRLEHARGIVGPLVGKAVRLGVVIAQPRPGSPIRTWLAAGIPLAYGSDMLRNPFFNMMQAVSSRPGTTSETITREQAVSVYTRGAAYAEFMEREKGTLAPGMLADIAVLSQDIFTVAPAALPATTSVMTLVGGRVVRDVISPAPPAVR
ncbi:MAG: amidohydrolase [Gemmatimonadota bacterium]|nr:amidohydrolase [Gemmatimonadota bacterium]